MAEIDVVDLAGFTIDATPLVVSGPRGPQGPPGSGGLSAVVHTQSSPLSSWSITHSLGRFPLISVFVGGSEVIADIDVTTSNATITFASPTSGVAVLA